MAAIEIELIEGSEFMNWYEEAEVPQASREEVEAISPYIAVLEAPIAEFIYAHSPYPRADVKLKPETYAHILLHREKMVKMQYHIAVSYSGIIEHRTYDFDVDFEPFAEQYRSFVETLEKAAERQRAIVEKRKKAAQRQLERLRKRKQIADKMVRISHTYAETMKRMDRTVANIEEAMSSIALANEHYERIRLEKEYERLRNELDRAREEYRLAQLEKAKLEQEKSMWQKAKDLAKDTYNKAKNIVSKGVDKAKDVFRSVFGFSKGEKTDTKGDTTKGDTKPHDTKGRDTGGPDI